MLCYSRSMHDSILCRTHITCKGTLVRIVMEEAKKSHYGSNRNRLVYVKTRWIRPSAFQDHAISLRNLLGS